MTAMSRACTLVLALVAPLAGLAEPGPDTSRVALHVVQQDVAAAGILRELKAAAPQGLVVFRNVQLVDPLDASVVPRQSVIVRAPRIVWVGDTASEPRLPEATVVDGGGRYLVPGLNDMHVHASSAAGWLLQLGNGVTAVRDMAGSPWMLKARAAIEAGRMLAPSLRVAGPLFNAQPLEGYAVVPADSLAARRLVRQQAACGYDFIKVHNVLPEPVFDAVAEQARALGMDLVGHVPHDIPVRHAVQAGMRTLEHLKGYLDDRTLAPGETDYAPVAQGAAVWNTPTLQVGQQFATGDEARRLLAAPGMRYVPLRTRARWEASLREPIDDGLRRGQASVAYVKQIVGALHAARARVLAGTDADGYRFQVMGFALLDELALLEQAGLSPAEALRAATTAPAEAMRLEREVGRIRRGMRADLVLLESNPLEGTVAFRRNLGVVAHGWWLERARLDAAFERLAAIADEPDDDVRVDLAAVDEVATEAEALARDGFVFDAGALGELAGVLRGRGWNDRAHRIAALADLPTQGPCVDVRPR